MLFLISAFLGYDISFIRVGLMYRLQCRSTRSPTTTRMRNEGSCVCSRFRCFSNQVLLPRLITLYQILHDNIHAKSGQESTLKLQYIRTEREAVMGWVSISGTSYFYTWLSDFTCADHTTVRDIPSIVAFDTQECRYQCRECYRAVGWQRREEALSARRACILIICILGKLDKVQDKSQIYE